MADNFLIAPFDKDSGLQNQYKSWLIPDQAFAELTNAYVYRGRIRKRFGTRYMGNTQLESRFRVKIGTTGGALVVPLTAGTPTVTPAVGQMFSVGTTILTVNTVSANPATLLSTLGTVTGTFNTVTGAVNIAGVAGGVDVYYYPSLPVMGLRTFETVSVNNETLVGFDTKFAYSFSNGWTRMAGETSAGAASWTGDDTDFFWTCTWTGADAATKVLFVTNNNENEAKSLRYYLAGQWSAYAPLVTAADHLYGARIIVPFKNRLLVLNTWEGAGIPGTNYPNRARYSQIGSPFDVSAWRQDIAGKGNAIDCPTTESIITAEFIKDRLIVYFESSTWELVYTGNQAYPFAWQQINTELGCESTFSVVPFDKVAIGIGNVGVHACNGANTSRIDQKIPLLVFDIHSLSEGVNRVYGIRDYFVEMLYWTIPDGTRSVTNPYPNRVLVFNYDTGTWAINNDSITCFGYYNTSTASGLTWDSETVTWDSSDTWDSGSYVAGFRNVVGGNQQGYTFLVDSGCTINASVLQITDITVVNNVVTITSVNHNLTNGDYVYIDDVISTGNLTLMNYSTFMVTATTQHTFTFSYGTVATLGGVYLGGGTIARVSKINIKTKEYNFYADKCRNAYVSRIDFLVDSTEYGELTVDYFISTASPSMLNASPGVQLGSGVLTTYPYTTVPFEATASRLWHTIYLQADGECIQLSLTMNDTQMVSQEIRSADFQMHAMLFTATPSSYRLGA